MCKLFKSKHRLFFIILSFFFSICIFIGCHIHPVLYYKLYNGPDRSKDEISILKGYRPLYLISINGIKSSSGSDGHYNYDGFEVKLLPGIYVLEVEYHDYKTYRAPQTYTLEAKPGKTYSIINKLKNMYGSDWVWVYEGDIYN